MEPKKLRPEEKVFYGIMLGGGYLVIMFYLAHYFYLDNTGGITSFDGVMDHIKSSPFDLFPFPTSQVLSFGFMLALVIGLVLVQIFHRKRFVPGMEEGSAGWNTNSSAYNKTYTEPAGSASYTVTDDKGVSKNMILSQNTMLSMDTRQTQRNNNILVVGGSGAGKSRFVVKPNLLQRNCSYVVTDPSGELLESTGTYLEENGYDVKVFNLVEMSYSDRYNPFHYIRDDNGVNQMINTLITNTTGDNAKGEKFWIDSETALLMAICLYLYYEVVPEDQNFGNVMRMILLGQVQETNEMFESPLDKIFNALEKKDPTHLAVKYYKIFKQAAGKTAKSILISCSVRLSAFNLQSVQELTNTDSIDLTHVGDKPTVLFVVIPAADTTFNFLVSMMYSQMFESLYFHAENEIEGKRLPTHVRFMLDEFANIGTIPDFEKKLATMRKYEISCTIILQNLAQLKAMYKDNWESLTGNCDEFIFLGGQEQSTLEYVSKKLGKATILGNNYTKSQGQTGSYSTAENFKGRDLMTPDEIARMDNKNCIIFVRGERPFFDKKYDYPKHPMYKYTGDADSRLNYDYRSRYAKLRMEELQEKRLSEIGRMNRFAPEKQTMFDENVDVKINVVDATKDVDANTLKNEGEDASGESPADPSFNQSPSELCRNAGVSEGDQKEIADDIANGKFDSVIQGLLDREFDVKEGLSESESRKIMLMARHKLEEQFWVNEKLQPVYAPTTFADEDDEEEFNVDENDTDSSEENNLFNESFDLLRS